MNEVLTLDQVAKDLKKSIRTVAKERKIPAVLVSRKGGYTYTVPIQTYFDWKKDRKGKVEEQNYLSDLSFIQKEKQEWIDPYYIAIVHLSLGERQQALESLEKAFAVKSVMLAWLKVDPKFKSLHAESRFMALVRKMRLDP